MIQMLQGTIGIYFWNLTQIVDLHDTNRLEKGLVFEDYLATELLKY